MSEYDDAWQDPSAKLWVQHVIDKMVPAMNGSALVASIVPSTGDGDVQFWVELGASIMLDKPIRGGRVRMTGEPPPQCVWDTASRPSVIRAMPSVGVLVETPWRTGRKVGRTVYAQLGPEPSDRDPLIGVMDTPQLAKAAVDAHNAALARRHHP